MAAIGSDILASEYVAIQDAAELLLGTGSATRGYGQTVQSTDVFSGNAITKAQWDALRFDIVNLRLHQDGTTPSIVTVNIGDVIGYGAAAPNTNYASLLATADTNRFLIDVSQSVVTSKGSAVRTTSWSTQCQFTLTVTFATATQGRHFFNSGGKVRLTTSLSGGTATAQYNAWVNFLNTVATKSFGATNADIPAVNYYTLTNSYQTYFQGSLSTTYSANTFVLEARSNVSNNSTGTATQLELRVTLADNYVDPGPGNPPPDLVDGTLTIAVEELKAAGNLLPSGTFSITSPTYSLSAIAGS